MGYEIVAGLLCIAWAAVYALRRSRPDAVPARSCGATHRKRNN
jgi:hypothetical protein